MKLAGLPLLTGLVRKIQRGNKAYYAANSSHPAFKDLKCVLIKTVVFSNKVENELAKIKNKIIYGFIYGSTASNSDTSMSDIDLFLIGNIRFEDAGYLSYSLSLELGREVNTVIYSLKDFKEKMKEKYPFIIEVIQSF